MDRRFIIQSSSGSGNKEIDDMRERGLSSLDASGWDYIHGPVCKHGIPIFDAYDDCKECFEERKRKKHQEQHEESVKKQKNQIRRPKVLESK
jgi:hypothetical protein